MEYDPGINPASRVESMTNVRQETRVLRLSVLLAACVVAAACGVRTGEASTGAGPPVQDPSPEGHMHEPAAQGTQQEHAHGAATSLPATAGPGYTVADVRFMQHMIGHHAQAVTMAALVPSRGAGERLQRLAQKIDISQRDEIGFMKWWLEERGQAVPADAQAHAMRMPGMLTAEQMAELAAARGVEFERLFLTFMIQHHRGALTMVEELFDSPAAAQEPDVFRFATDVDADQRDEIYVMQTMLDMLESDRGSRSR
jgi:uncharacterized protein (DUF305 family)